MRCRHERNSWLIGLPNSLFEWCYVCGALRRMRASVVANTCTAATGWVKPTGSADKNPMMLPILRKRRV